MLPVNEGFRTSGERDGQISVVAKCHHRTTGWVGGECPGWLTANAVKIRRDIGRESERGECEIEIIGVENGRVIIRLTDAEGRPAGLLQAAGRVRERDGQRIYP